MKRKLTVWMLLFAAAVLGFGMTAQNAQAVLLNFDDVASGTNISNQYAGVTFSKLLNGVDGGPVYANGAFPTSSESSPNVISIFDTVYPGFDNRFGTIHASFASAQNSVSIDVLLAQAPEGFGTTGIAYMRAFDSGGNTLSTVQTSVLNSYQTLSIAASDIMDVYFTVQFMEYPTYGIFDNFNFTSGSGGDNGNGGTPVPEPATMLLIGTGIAGLGFAKRYAKS